MMFKAMTDTDSFFHSAHVAAWSTLWVAATKGLIWALGDKPFFGNDRCLEELIAKVEEHAKLDYDGHYTIFAFSSGYKACFGTPNLGNADPDDLSSGRSQVWTLPAFGKLEDALVYLLDKKSSRIG